MIQLMRNSPTALRGLGTYSPTYKPFGSWKKKVTQNSHKWDCAEHLHEPSV